MRKVTEICETLFPEIFLVISVYYNADLREKST